jgi:hypothetical protein
MRPNPRWSVIVESDGPARDTAKARPTDRPVLYTRGHPTDFGVEE